MDEREGSWISSLSVGGAVLGGPLPWRNGRSESASTALLTLTAAFMALSLVTAAFITSAHTGTRPLALLAAAGTAGYLGPEAVMAVAGNRDLRRMVSTRIWLRPPALAMAVIGLVLTLHWAGVLFGGVVGVEAAVTLNLIGLRPEPRNDVHRWARSSVHAGVLVGMLGTTLVTRAGPMPAMVYLAVLSALIIAAVATYTASEWGRRVDGRHERALTEQRERDAAHFSGWLHDQVSNPVRLLRLRVAQGNLDEQGLAKELDQLEHVLRTGQVDHLIDSGIARLRDVTQPYLRLAERHGVDVADVPDATVGELHLPTATARLAARTIAILVNNSLQAGATTISMRARHEPGTLRLEVEDDAGGIRVAPVHAGRSLTELQHALGGRLQLRPTPTGTNAVAEIAMP